MKKNKRDNSVLCYIGLVFLIILLLLPPGLRLFGKNLYEKKEEIKKDVVTILSCRKSNETISSTFMNSEPQNISYHIKGKYDVKLDEEQSDAENITFVEIIKPYATIEYKENDNETVFSVQVGALKEVKNYAVIFSSIENQTKYFDSEGFFCEKSNYE